MTLCRLLASSSRFARSDTAPADEWYSLVAIIGGDVVSARSFSPCARNEAPTFSLSCLECLYLA